AAQDQAPQNQEEPEVVARDRRCHQAWKYRDQRAAEADQPHLVPRPERPDRRYDLASFLRSTRDEPVQHSSSEIAPIEHHVGDQHEADDAVPHRDHGAITSTFGPRPISRPTRKRNKRPSTKYRPVNPINVKTTSPLLTTSL